MHLGFQHLMSAPEQGMTRTLSLLSVTVLTVLGTIPVAKATCPPAKPAPGIPASDTGLMKTLDDAAAKPKLRDRILSEALKPKPAANPTVKDMFGRSVNPITLMPG